MTTIKIRALTEKEVYKPAVNKEEGKIDHLSASQVNTFLSCPVKWYFSYVRGIKIPPSIAFVFGRAIHSGLENIYRHKQQGKKFNKTEVLDLVETKFEEEAQDVDASTKSEKIAQKIKAVNIMEQYIDNKCPDEVPDESIEAVEAERKIKLYDATAKTMVDVIVKQDLILKDRIRDFKTSKGIPSEIPQKYKLQLALYAIEGSKPKAEIEFLAKTKAFKREIVTLSVQDLKYNKNALPATFLAAWKQMRTIAAIKDLDELIAKKILLPTGLSSDWACKYCAYGEQGFCPFYMRG